MEDLLKSLPASFTSFVGLAFCLGVLIMLGTFFQEWAKTLYRSVRGTKEKRHGGIDGYTGYERRAENKGVEQALLELAEQIRCSNMLVDRFITNWKEKVPDAIEAIEEIKRKQDANWNRLYHEELPSLRHR